MTTRLFTLYFFIYVVYSKECYWNSCSYVLFGSKTLYNDVRGDVRDIPKLEGCTPINVWMLVRHGARNPNSYDLNNMKNIIPLKNEIINNHSEGRGEICAQDIDNIKNWKWNDNIDTQTNNLIETGFTEVEQLGARIKERFSHFLTNVQHYEIRPTKRQRTIETARAFNQGLGYKLGFNITPPMESDQVLHSFKYCPRHMNEIYNGPRTPMEMNRYYESEEFKQLQRNMEKRTGLKELSVKNVIGIYDLCRFYRAYYNTSKSAWCALFTKDELQIIEYTKDLQHYFRNGYGNSMNSKLSGPVLRDLYQSFKNAYNTTKTRFTAYFSHDSLIDMIYGALGLYHDYPELTGFKRIIDRKWRISLITPLAANFIAVLHRCKTPANYRVQFFINEKEVQLCCNRTCSWEEFEDKFNKFDNSTLDFCIIK